MGLLIPEYRAAPLASTYQANFSGRPTTTWGTTLTASATLHTVGTTVQLVASAPYDADGIRITFHGMHTSAAVTEGLVNIFTGASNEKTLIANLMSGWSATNVTAGPRRYFFPLRIPKGTRIAANFQAVIASDDVYCMIELLSSNGNNWAGCAVETLGAVTATTKGTTVVPGTTSEGTLTSIGTSGQRYKYIYAAQSGNADTTATAGVLSYDIGTSSAVIPGLENFVQTTSATEWVNPWDEVGRYCDIASGTALYLRAQSHTTDTENKTFCIYGVY